MRWVIGIIDDAFPHFVVTNKPVMVAAVVRDHLREQRQKGLGELRLRVQRIEKHLALVVKGRFRGLERVVDGGRLRLSLRVNDVQQHAPAVAAGLGAVSLHEQERMIRQGSVVHWKDRATFALGFFREKGMKTKHGLIQ